MRRGRVLAADGTLWLVMGDAYSSGRRAASNLASWSSVNGRGGAHRIREAQRGRHGASDLPPKNLMAMPWRVAFALQDDGWILRNEIVWVKANPMPESVKDRAIRAGCRPGRTVLDMFSGSGTMGLAAAELGHRYVGIDINVDYLELNLQTRLEQPSLIID